MVDVYNLKKPSKIKILIFNHTRFRNRRIKARPAQIGVNFEDFFLNQLGEFVDVSHFYDLGRDDVTQELIKASDEGINYSALIVCVSSHGNLIEDDDGIFYEIIHAQDRFYYKSDLWRHFKDKEDWKYKPKLFFIQACRGEDATAGVVLSHDACVSEEEATPVFSEPKYPDLFIMNASQQGTVSWKCNNGDSLFIDALIKVFNEKFSKWDLLSMAVEISDRVAKDHEVCTMMPPPTSGATSKYDCCQQMPCFETTLTKKFYFPNALPDMRSIYGNDFYENIRKPLAIVLNYSYEGTRFSSNAAKARTNKNAIKIGLINAGFKYMKFWDVSKADLAKLLKTQYQMNNRDMILVIFNGYGERDELYLNDEKIKVYELWEPLLPDVKTGEVLSGKPKIFLISASPPEPNLEGVSGKIDKLCKPPTDGNVQKCQDELDGGEVNVPTTADLFICYETGAAKTSYKCPGFQGSPFMKMFSDELMKEDNKDFFSIFTKILYNFATPEKSFNEEAPMAFSTLRKLVPVRCSDSKRFFPCLNLSFLKKLKFC